MTRRRAFLAAAALLVAAGVSFLLRAPRKPASPAPVVATVRVAPLRLVPVHRTLIAYGRVVAAPSALQAVTEPFAVVVSGVNVNLGQPIARGATLMTLVPAADTRLALLRARTDYHIARLTLAETRERYTLQLATRSQLLAAERGFDNARAALRLLRREGLRSRMEVKAPVRGVVSRVFAQEGAIVAAGQPLMELVARDRLEVRLGAEAEDIGNLEPGTRVTLRSFASDRQGVRGLVSVVSRVVNPATHMVDVFVALPRSNPYLLGEYVEGRFVTTSPPVLVAPRSAVLPVDHRETLYTVVNGRAVAHVVRLGVRNHHIVQVIGAHLRPGEPVVVLGNYELKPGMRVKVA